MRKGVRYQKPNGPQDASHFWYLTPFRAPELNPPDFAISHKQPAMIDHVNVKLVLGLWPIAGVTTIGVTRQDARATIQAAIEHGITTFDSAYSYGYDGESDRLLGQCIGRQRDQFQIFGKVGQRWNSDRQRIVDASPKQLTCDAEESLRRMGLEYVDLLFLHSPDPNVALCHSAEAMEKLCRRGLCRRIGVCNVTQDQWKEFSSCVANAAIQCPLNLVQRQSQSQLIEPAGQAGQEVYVFWVLMKGLLAGKINREHRFPPGDSRPTYPIFQGDFRRMVHDAIDEIKLLGRAVGQTMSQMAIGWATAQPGVTAALVGARRPDQIVETAGTKPMSQDVVAKIDSIIDRCVSNAVD